MSRLGHDEEFAVAHVDPAGVGGVGAVVDLPPRRRLSGAWAFFMMTAALSAGPIPAAPAGPIVLDEPMTPDAWPPRLRRPDCDRCRGTGWATQDQGGRTIPRMRCPACRRRGGR